MPTSFVYGSLFTDGSHVQSTNLFSGNAQQRGRLERAFDIK